MATLFEEPDRYFSSVSKLAGRVYADVERVKQACVASSDWEGLTVEQQELVMDRLLIDTQALEKYSSAAKSHDYPDCFPVLKLNSGEKIIVDFENEDGWTWADEHSGPFSWKTKSQQDLSLDDLDDLTGSKEALNKKNRFVRSVRSPDRSVWENPFMSAGDRDKSEIEKMFKKFGIKMAADDDSPSKDSHSETSKLIGQQNRAYSATADDDALDHHGKPSSAGKEKKSEGEQKKKHKHKKDKRDKEKKGQQSKSKSKLTNEQEVSTSQAVRQSAMPSSGDIVFATTSNQASDDDLRHSYSSSSVSRAAEMVEFGLPHVHSSCRTNVVFSETPGESTTDDVKLIPQAQVDSLGTSGPMKSELNFLYDW